MKQFPKWANDKQNWIGHMGHVGLGNNTVYYSEYVGVQVFLYF